MTQRWHDDVDASDTAMSLVTAEVTVDEAMFSTHGGRRQQYVNAGERCQEMARTDDGDGEGDGNSDGVCDGDGHGDGNGLGWDDRDGSGYVASDGDNAGEQVMATAMMATGTATATATATAMATARGQDSNSDGNGGGYGADVVVAKTRTYIHHQLEFFLSDTSCWIQKKYKKLKYIHK